MESINFFDKYHVRFVCGKHVERFIVKNHYAQRVPSIMYAFGLFKDKEMIGVITFGSPPSPSLQNKIPFDFLELNRIALIKNEKNLVSWWIKQCINQLPKPQLLISFADQNQKHIGYVYQASNWIYTGLSTINHEYMVNGKIIHSRHLDHTLKDAIKIEKLSKYRYFFPIGSKLQKKKMRKWIEENYSILPYPKGVSEQYNMDEERRKRKGMINNGSLF